MKNIIEMKVEELIDLLIEERYAIKIRQLHKIKLQEDSYKEKIEDFEKTVFEVELLKGKGICYEQFKNEMFVKYPQVAGKAASVGYTRNNGEDILLINEYLYIIYQEKVRILEKDDKNSEEKQIVGLKVALLWRFLCDGYNGVRDSLLQVNYKMNNGKDKDIFELSADESYVRFFQDMEDENYSEAKLVWGRLSIKQNDSQALLANLYFKEENYIEAINYGKRVINNAYIETLVLEAYAMRGDVKGFNDCVCNKFKLPIGEFLYRTFLMELILNSDYEKTGIIDEQTNKLIDLGIKGLDIIYSQDKKTMDYKEYIITLLEVLTRAIEEMLHFTAYIELSDENCKNELELGYQKYLTVFMIFEKNIYNEFKKMGEDLFMGIHNIYLYFGKELLMGENSIQHFVKYIDFFFRIGEIRFALKILSENIDEIIIHTNDSKRINQSISNLLLKAYGESQLLDKYDNNNFKEVIDKLGIFDILFEDEIKYRKIISTLSINAKVEYDSACRMFSILKESNYGSGDAGMIALAFYRIIEYESNVRIWIPIISKISPNRINEVYRNTLETLSKKDVGNTTKTNKNQVSRYKFKWDQNIKIFRNMVTKKINTEEKMLMLGALNVLTKTIHNDWKNDPLAEMLRKEFLKILTDEGNKAFEDGKLIKWYSDENRNKYRNPPAHNKYIHFKVAEECKEYLEEQFLLMDKWIKKVVIVESV